MSSFKSGGIAGGLAALGIAAAAALPNPADARMEVGGLCREHAYNDIQTVCPQTCDNPGA